MIKKIILLMLLLIPLSMAFPSGEKYEVVGINQCHGVFNVHVRGIGNLMDYTIPGCKYIGNRLWECRCNINSLTPVYILPNSNVEHDYDIKIEYYTKPERIEQNKRNLEFNNLHFEKTNKKVQFQAPDINKSAVWLIIIAILSIVVIIFGIRYILKLYKDEEI